MVKKHRQRTVLIMDLLVALTEVPINISNLSTKGRLGTKEINKWIPILVKRGYVSKDIKKEVRSTFHYCITQKGRLLLKELIDINDRLSWINVLSYDDE